MTLRGLFAVWRASALDPVRFDVARARREAPRTCRSLAAAARARRRGEGCGCRSRRGRGAGRVRVREPRLPRDARDDRRRRRHRRGDRRRLVRLRPPRAISPRIPRRSRRNSSRPTPGALESFSFTAPVAYLLELLMLWSDTVARRDLRHRRRAGHDRRARRRMALATRTFRWEGFAIDRGRRQPHRRRHPDGLRRRHRARLHDRAGAVRHLDARGRLVPRACARSSPAASRRCATRYGGWSGRLTSRPQGQRPARPRYRPMIVFDLACAHGHRFEGWFASGEEFERQQGAGLVRCPVCDDARRRARAVGAGARAQGAPPAQPVAAVPAPAARRPPTAPWPACPPELVGKLREIVRNTENVGDRFPEEARKIHYEEVPAARDPRPGLARGSARRCATKASTSRRCRRSSRRDRH